MSDAANHMPNLAARDQLRETAGPVVMLNLLKYRQPGGRDAFNRYGAVTGPLIVKAEGEVLFAGRALVGLAGADVDWDDVLIVRFPSAAHFLEMIESDTYTGTAAPIRHEALEATVWVAMQAFADANG